MSETTEWISHLTPPVRVGLYECLYEDHIADPVFRYWDGAEWNQTNFSGPCDFGRGADKWRGLTRTAYLKAGGKR